MNNIDLLKSYMKTGLTPEKILELKDNLKTLQGRCRANQSGWLCNDCKIDCYFKEGTNVITGAGYRK